MIWNTGCNTISNLLPAGFNVLDGEDERLAITVKKGAFADWKSVIFPWCNSTPEVKDKAFRFANIKTGHVFMYMFQNYQTNRVCWSLNLHDPWAHKKVVRNGLKSRLEQHPLSALDIYVMPDRVCGLAAQSENDTFKTIFDEALSVGSLVGEIAGAVVGE